MEESPILKLIIHESLTLIFAKAVPRDPFSVVFPFECVFFFLSSTLMLKTSDYISELLCSGPLNSVEQRSKKELNILLAHFSLS